jgi:SpoVK/Ycf46/Vps4 family AAA+-type ATPase
MADSSFSKQAALSRVLRVLSVGSSKGILYATALLGVSSIFPILQLPAVLGTVAGGLGIEAMGILLDRVSSDSSLDDAQVRAIVEEVIKKSRISELLTRDDFHHAFTYLKQEQEIQKAQNKEILHIVRRVEETIKNRQIVEEKEQSEFSITCGKPSNSKAFLLDFLQDASSRKIPLKNLVLSQQICTYFKDFFIPSVVNPVGYANFLSRIENCLPEEVDLPRRIILLQGPPGTGKTSLAYSVAFETGLAFYAFQLGNFDGSTQSLSDAFRCLQNLKPCICFIDELDSVAKRRVGHPSAIVTQLIIELDKIAADEIVFIAATNLPDLIDPTLIRRFHVINFSMPSQIEREQLVRLYFRPIWKCISPELTVSEIASLMKNVAPMYWKHLTVDAAIQAITQPNYQLTRDTVQEYAKRVTGSGRSPIL